VLKRHVLDQQGNIGQLPALLAQQLPLVGPHLNDGLTTVLGLGGAAAFANSVPSQLRAVTAHFEHPVAPTPAAPANAAADKSRPATSAVVEPSARDVRRGGLKARHWFGVAALSALIGALVALLTWVALANCPYAASLSGRVANVAANVAATGAVADSPADAAAASVAVPASDSAASTTGTVQTSAAPAPTKDAALIFSVDRNGKPTINATVQSIAEKSALLNALTKKFGAGHFNADIAADESTKPADWLSRIDGLLPLMELPGAEVKIDGTHVELSGTAADAKAGWPDRLKALFGASYQIGTFDAGQAVADATLSFKSAIRSMLAPGAPCAIADVVKVLNLQVVNFASSDAHVPPSAIDDLNQSAQLLKACSHNGKAPKLEVAGYSDDVGGAAANLELSKERAEAVRSFLVKAGISADALVARGYGNLRPVASNATAGGRFANRRIEFSEAQPQPN
jgi:outer membrane protein OmpA-like peptidoglycan-associated protein